VRSLEEQARLQGMQIGYEMIRAGPKTSRIRGKTSMIGYRTSRRVDYPISMIRGIDKRSRRLPVSLICRVGDSPYR
jgi:hypothetical protein